jgi:hypothetical protein
VRPAFPDFAFGTAAWLRTLIFAAVVAMAGAFAAAQDDPIRRPRMDTNPAPTQPPPGGVQQKSRPFYLEGAVVAALCGGAVFAVGRNSRRQ